MQIYIVEAVLLIFLILITCAVIFCKDILSAAIIYSGFSFCAVLLYLMMGSPDVAFTEAVIGTISTIFFVYTSVIKNTTSKKVCDQTIIHALPKIST